MIDVAASWEDGDKKDGLILTIANHMKKCFLNWNKDTVQDDVIFAHLFDLSDGKINLKDSEEDLSDASNLVQVRRKTAPVSSTKKNYKATSNSGNKRKRH